MGPSVPLLDQARGGAAIIKWADSPPWTPPIPPDGKARNALLAIPEVPPFSSCSPYSIYAYHQGISKKIRTFQLSV